ncbi:MAG TPA: toll/interleukin-1 receptor domain-containing protein [Pyrinomonadaceae bacterium]|jgi:hypothetical protein
MKIFISWSGPRSKAVAQALRDWLPEIFDAVKPWMSEQDIRAGSLWYDELRRELGDARFCIVCLDNHSLSAPWVLFEAGFAARGLTEAVCPYLIDGPLDINATPLSVYQSRPATEEGTLGLLRAINRLGGEELLTEERLKKKFDREWPSLDRRLKTLPTHLLARGGESPFRVNLFNTWFISRKGHVALDWEPIHRQTRIPPDELVVRDEHGNELPAQVDRFRAPDPTPPSLVFSLLADIPPARDVHSAPSSYVTLERGKPTPWDEQVAELAAEGRELTISRVRLSNSQLAINLELLPEPFDDGRPWYAGAVTRARLNGQEMLDAFREQLEWLGEDVEKRCMQLDELQLITPNGDPIEHDACDLIGKPYELISHFSGPARAVVTIASRPFSHTPKRARAGADGGPQQFRLYRTISLYRGVGYVAEELKVYGYRVGRKPARPVSLGFLTRYFSYMEMGFDQEVVHEKDAHWFAVGSRKLAPFPGYGFAAGGELARVDNPDPRFPQQSDTSKTYAWNVRAPGGAGLRCVHLFTLGTTWAPDTERVWEEVISKPLVARFEPPRVRETSRAAAAPARRKPAAGRKPATRARGGAVK